MRPLSYMRSVVDRNVVMRRIPVMVSSKFWEMVRQDTFVDILNTSFIPNRRQKVLPRYNLSQRSLPPSARDRWLKWKARKKVVNEATIDRKKATKIFARAKVIYNLEHKGSCKSLHSKEFCSLQTEGLINTIIFANLFLVFILATYYIRNPGRSEIFWVDDSTQRLAKAKCILRVRKSRQQFAKETILCAMAPNTCVSTGWNLPYVGHPAPRVSR